MGILGMFKKHKPANIRHLESRMSGVEHNQDKAAQWFVDMEETIKMLLARDAEIKIKHQKQDERIKFLQKQVDELFGKVAKLAERLDGDIAHLSQRCTTLGANADIQAKSLSEATKAYKEIMAELYGSNQAGHGTIERAGIKASLLLLIKKFTDQEKAGDPKHGN